MGIRDRKGTSHALRVALAFVDASLSAESGAARFNRVYTRRIAQNTG